MQPAVLPVSIPHSHRLVAYAQDDGACSTLSADYTTAKQRA